MPITPLFDPYRDDPRNPLDTWNVLPVTDHDPLASLRHGAPRGLGSGTQQATMSGIAPLLILGGIVFVLGTLGARLPTFAEWGAFTSWCFTCFWFLHT